MVALRWLEEALDEANEGEDADTPWLTAVIRVTDGQSGNLEELLTCLAAQDANTSEWEMVLVVTPLGEESARRTATAFDPEFAQRCRITATGTEPENHGIRMATGRYLSILEPGQLITADWARRFIEGARSAPGRVVRVQGFQRLTVPGPGGGPMTLSRTTPSAPLPFELARHLRTNQMGAGTFAVPRRLCHPKGVWYSEDRREVADWAFALKAAMVSGVADFEHRTVITTRAATDPAAPPTADDLEGALGGCPLIVEPEQVGAVLNAFEEPPEGEVARSLQMEALVGQVRLLQDQASDLYAEVERVRSALAAAEADRDVIRSLYEEIRTSQFWQVTAPLRASVDVARKATSRLKRRDGTERRDP